MTSHPVQSPAARQTGAQPLELLAPAGGLDAGYAAFHYGADAVYLGLSRFSARAEAANFSWDDLAELVGFAHSRPARRRVYVTVNTLVQDAELEAAAETLAALAELGVDAVIVQDLGLVRLARERLPGLRLHASTQMAVHNRPGAELARELGLARVTLARELTIPEIAAIAGRPGLETEVFIHGALCYGYSGLCLFSSHQAGRSGNRGRCAYLCRHAFRGAPGGPFVFSMKDLAARGALPALRRAGVASLKIEGRMKSPLYVAAVVHYYRQALDGRLTSATAAGLEADIRTIFSRPWTDLYLTQRRNTAVMDSDIVGHRGAPIGRVERLVRLRSGEARIRFHSSRPLEVHDGLQIDVAGQGRPFGFAVERLRLAGAAPAAGKPAWVFEAPAGAEVEITLPPDPPPLAEGASIYCASSQAVKRRYRFETPKRGLFRARIPVRFEVEIRANRLRLKATAAAGMAGTAPITADAEFAGSFPQARGAGQRAAVESALAKLGATRFTIDGVSLSDPGSRFVPVSLLNQARRQVIDVLDARCRDAAAARLAAVKAGIPGPSPDPGAEEAPPPLRWSLKTDQPAALAAFTDMDWRGVEEAIVVLTAAGLRTAEDAARALSARLGRGRLRLALPTLLRRDDLAVLEPAVRRLAAAGWHRWQAGNLGAWQLLAGCRRTAGPGSLDVEADWPLYVLNRLAADELAARGASSVTLSPEDDGANLRRLLPALGARAVLIVYQDTPLMISEHAPGPVSALALADGTALRVEQQEGRAVLLGERPFCLAPFLPALRAAGLRRVRADFLHRPYPADRALAAWRALRGGRPPGPAHPGNFERGLL